MLSKIPRKTPKTIGFRLTFWYSAIFIVSASLLFLFVYIYLETTLVRKDHDETLSRARELGTLYQSGGLSLFVKGVAASKKAPGKNKFFIRLASRDNRTIYIYLPYQWVGFNIRKLETLPPVNGKWIRIPDRYQRIALEVYAARLRDGRWLEVGQDTRERQRILAKFKGVATIIVLPLFLLGVLGGSFLSYRALYPIRNLIHTVHAVSEDMEALGKRVPDPRSGDELEELVTLFNQMLEKIDTLIRAMKNSLDNVAHDLRTPVTRLRCRAELALQAGEDTDEYRKAVEECLEESLIIQKLLDTLMDISEAETGAMKLDLQSVRIDQVIRKVVEIYSFVAEEKGVEIKAERLPELSIEADPTRLGQGLANLLDNAVKFTPEGGRVIVKAFQEDEKAVIIVQDTGCGIPEKDLPRIWDRLYRGDQSRSKKGLGLGLSLVRAIITLHQGSIEVKSAPGKGTTFIISLPLRRMREALQNFNDIER